MATYTNLNDEIFANSALEGFTTKLASFARFSRNFSPDGSRRGDTVLVPLIGTLTATTFGGSYAISGGTQTVVTVSLNRHKVVHLGQDDLTYHASSKASLESFGFQQGKALATAIMSDVLTLCTTANFTSVTAVASTAMAEAQLRAVRLALNVADASEDRSMLIDCTPYDALLGVTNFVNAHNFYDSTVSREGKIMRAYGFDFVELNNLFGSVNSVMAFAAAPSAVAIAMRYLAPQEGNKYATAAQLTDPETGLTLGLRKHYDENTGTAYVNLEALYGYSVGISNGGRIVKRTD